MLKYMRADLYRITRQIPRYILLVLFIGFYVISLTADGISKEMNGLGIGFPIREVLILCVYIVGLFWIGSAIFSKRELDF